MDMKVAMALQKPHESFHMLSKSCINYCSARTSLTTERSVFVMNVLVSAA